jgi:epoxyqueuosine reductase
MTRVDAENLRADLRALGFDEVRFAVVDTAAVSSAAGFSAWLRAGHHGDMAWLADGEARRLDPQLVLSGVRSAIVLGVDYLPAGAAATQQRWAKYALHTDYHETIGRALRAAGDVLEARTGIARDDHRAYVDTGPVLERGWAAKAGLGWLGKNAMLLSRTHGNWLFLAVILTRLEIPADAVEGSPAGYCGSCTRCLTACPTQAFPRPGWVDARRCISYHTIENRGVIPRELRAAFGPRVFGCDTCLDVCPWNRFARAGRSALLEARAEIAGLSLLDLLGMDEARFRAVFRKTAIKRTKLAGLLRNACIAAGNWDASAEWHFGGAEDRAAVLAAIERLCAHESEIVRAHAVWALFRLVGAEAATARLAAVHAKERSPLVLPEYAAAEKEC